MCINVSNSTFINEKQQNGHRAIHRKSTYLLFVIKNDIIAILGAFQGEILISGVILVILHVKRLKYNITPKKETITNSPVRYTEILPLHDQQLPPT